MLTAGTVVTVTVQVVDVIKSVEVDGALVIGPCCLWTLMAVGDKANGSLLTLSWGGERTLLALFATEVFVDRLRRMRASAPLVDNARTKRPTKVMNFMIC